MSPAIPATGGDVSTAQREVTNTPVSLLRSDVNIDLDDHYEGKVYTSHTPIKGKVRITTRREVCFDLVQIILLGVTTTCVDGLNVQNRVHHTFLKMYMPVPDEVIPSPRVFESGKTHSFPFHFVVPSHLSINACAHKVDMNEVQDQHLRMPPSVGHWAKDDMAPPAIEVTYNIMTRIFRRPATADEKWTKVIEGMQRVQILPASSLEDPPLEVAANDVLYRKSRSKMLRKSILAHRLGRLDAEAAQPVAIFVSHAGREASGTSTQVRVEFHPAVADIPPPRIASVSSKIVAHTLYSGGVNVSFPDRACWAKEASPVKRELFSNAVVLPEIETKVRWEQRSLHSRRDSGYASARCGHESDEESNASTISARRSCKWASSLAESAVSRYHAAVLEVPVKIPASEKMFIPTFHGCTASRVYTLQVTLNITTNAKAVLGSLSLSVPLQIVVEPDCETGGLPSFESLEFLEPRPERILCDSSIDADLLPGYHEFTGGCR